MKIALGLACFALGLALGWLLHGSEPVVAVAPASAPACPPEPVAEKTEKKHAAPVAIKAQAASAPTLQAPTDTAIIKACFGPEAYKGSSFVLKMETKNDGQVRTAQAVGAEFLSEREKKCVLSAAKRWSFGLDAPREVVMTVSM